MRVLTVTGVQTCALPISGGRPHGRRRVVGGGRLEGLSRPRVAARLLAEAAEGLRPYRRRWIGDGELDDRPERHRALAADDVEGRSEERRVGKGWRARWAA